MLLYRFILDGKLIFNDVSLDDKGIYLCHVELECDAWVSFTVYISFCLYFSIDLLQFCDALLLCIIQRKNWLQQLLLLPILSYLVIYKSLV